MDFITFTTTIASVSQVDFTSSEEVSLLTELRLHLVGDALIDVSKSIGHMALANITAGQFEEYRNETLGFLVNYESSWSP